MAKEPTDQPDRSGDEGFIYIAGDEVIHDGEAEALGVPPRTTPPPMAPAIPDDDTE